MATIDLNAARAARREKEVESHTVLFGEETFSIPGEAPWGFLEACMGGRAENQVAFLAVRAILADQYDRFIALSPTLLDATTLIEKATEIWGVNQGESEASGGSSTRTTGRSRRTSKGSTKSTSQKPSGDETQSGSDD